MDLSSCTLCPRKCKVNRYEKVGYCGQSDKIKIARADLHFWEEPCISGKNGSGTIFFSGCCLGCQFCQNYEISSLGKGYEITIERLSRIFLELQEKGAHNINLVTPTHFTYQIKKALDVTKDKLIIPIVYNSGGYENVETLKELNGYIDIYLPDLKFFSSEASKKYCGAEDYFEVATKAIKEMQKQTGKPKFDEHGNLLKGTVIRHLVMPSFRHDSIEVIKWIGETFNKDEILLSIMSQYSPFYNSSKFPEINRKVSTFEYNYVLKEADKFGFEGFSQEKTSADKAYIPKFSDHPE